MDEGEGNDPMDQFHGDEAISAVADDGFMGEDDEDYDDLYNDVNVGEGFLQSMRGKSDGVSGPTAVDEEEDDDDNQVDDPSPPPPPPPPPSQLSKEAQSSIPGAGGGSGEGSGGGDGGARYGQTQNNLGFRGNEIGAKPGMRVELGPVPVSGGVEDQPILHQPPPPLPLPLPPPPMAIPANHGGAGGSGTVLFVGDLHWWTTDSELESELCKYGQVKEVKFFDEKASGKSKGYCQVEFYDPAAATACKESMNGHLFNGRPCVVAYASPFNVKRMGEAQVNRAAQNQVSTGGLTAQNQPQAGSTRPGLVQQPLRRGLPDNTANNNNNNNLVSKPAQVGNYPIGNGENNNNRGGFGRGGWARGNGNRVGPVGQIRGRGLPGRGVIGNGFGPAGPNPMIHPQAAMMSHHHHHQGGFDPGFGQAAYGGFRPPFSGIISSFPPGVGLPGVAPHVNPAFFGRGSGMGMNGMGMMPGSAGMVEGPPGMMWADPGMAPWGSGNGNGNGNGDEQEAASDHQYTDDRGAWPNNNNNNMKEKERGGSERDWSGSSDRRYRDENRDPPAREKETAVGSDPPVARERRDRDRDRDRERERERSRDRERDRDRDHRDHRDHRERDRHREDREYHRYNKDRGSEQHHEEEWDRGRGSSRAHQVSKSRAHNQDDDRNHRSRSREADYGKRRRLTSD